jgi:ribosomal protein S18 acetylase RimI-like enzyme
VQTCAFCERKPQYRDRQTGQFVCPQHARLEVVAAGRGAPAPALSIRRATPADAPAIEDLSLYFWDETTVDCFDRHYDVQASPAFLACDGGDVVGLASYAVEADWNALVLVVLNVLPGYQGRGAGRALLNAVRDEAVQHGLGRILVVTSNDDLPALALYQRAGFQIVEVLPGRIAQHHGGEFPGLAGIMVRDEIRLALECWSTSRRAEAPPQGP